MDAAFLFLNGRYQTNDTQAVNDLSGTARIKPNIIAVDGGVSFLQKINLTPDHYIGDGDSFPALKLTNEFFRNTVIHSYEPAKDKTDTELALDFCLKNGLTKISIFGWMAAEDESDHFLGNLMLPFCARFIKRKMNIQFLGSEKQVYPLSNDRQIIKGQKGRSISVIPIDRTIVLSLTGTKYKATNLILKRGGTHGLRNIVTARVAKAEISGSGLLMIG